MKKYILTLFAFLMVMNASIAQNKTQMLGISTSYEIFDNRSDNYYGTSGNKIGSFLGIEYAESKRFFGYRTGIFYAQLKDQTFLNFEYPSVLNFIDIFILPKPSTLRIIDFPVSAQFYLPLGNSQIKLYANLGFMTSLAFFKDKTEFFYLIENENKSLSLRGIYGGGITYQFTKRFGLDIGVNQKRTFYTIDDDYRKPFNSLSFQTKLNYSLTP